MTTIGPSLPPLDKGDDSSSEDDYYGPKLPSTAGCRAPASAPQGGEDSDSECSDYGPSLPPGHHGGGGVVDSDSEGEMVGPKLAEQSEGASLGDTKREFEIRAKRMKDKLEGREQEEVKRETWMLELPEEKANSFGLLPTARQFSRKGVHEKGKDRSAWTDSPDERQRKLVEGDNKEEEVDTKTLFQRKRDREMEKVSGELKEKMGGTSLMNLHEDKMKKKRKEDSDAGDIKERRPFDRDVDLQANRFDEAAKKTMLKQAARINDRFSSGNQKFL